MRCRAGDIGRVYMRAPRNLGREARTASEGSCEESGRTWSHQRRVKMKRTLCQLNLSARFPMLLLWILILCSPSCGG